jgi:hypothetical protein
MRSNRRKVLQTASGLSLVSLAGCTFLTENQDEDPDQEEDSGSSYSVAEDSLMRRPAVSNGRENHTLQVYHSVTHTGSNRFIQQNNFALFEEYIGDVRVEFYDYPQTSQARSMHSILRHLQHKVGIQEYIDMIILAAVADEQTVDWMIETAIERNDVSEDELQQVQNLDVYQNVLQEDYQSIDATNPPHIVLDGVPVDNTGEELFERLDKF